MKINKEQLDEMINMQRQLDKYIMDKQGIEYTDEVSDKIRLALFVELGELFNELPSIFKHWKPNAVDDRAKALVEYVDCLHFAMSLHYFYSDDGLELGTLTLHEDCAYKNLDEILDYIFIIDTSLYHPSNLLSEVLNLGCYLGFTWDEVYNTYIEKNKINYDRQVNVKEYIASE